MRLQLNIFRRGHRVDAGARLGDRISTSARSAIRILYITDTLTSGGKERQLVELLRGSHKVYGICNELVVLSNVIHYDEVRSLGINIHILERAKKLDLSIFEKLYRIVRQYNPHVIFSWESMCSVYASPISLIFGSALVNGMIRDAPPALSVKDYRYRRLLLTAPFSSVILANSMAGLEAFRVRSNKGMCIRNGFNFDRIKDLPDINEIKRALDIRTEHIVGMIGRFNRGKDYKTFFEAAKLLCSERNDITFVAVGEGPDLERYKDYLKGECWENIRILGVRKRIEEIVKAFSIGVLVTDSRYHGEGIANAIMEYMALEKPVIATNAGGNREIVKDRESGFLVPSGDQNALALRIREIIDCPDMGSAFGRAGRALLEQKFNIEQMVQKHVELFRRLAGGNEPAAAMGRQWQQP